jgi:hypothetical protein
MTEEPLGSASSRAGETVFHEIVAELATIIRQARALWPPDDG